MHCFLLQLDVLLRLLLTMLLGTEPTVNTWGTSTGNHTDMPKASEQASNSRLPTPPSNHCTPVLSYNVSVIGACADCNLATNSVNEIPDHKQLNAVVATRLNCSLLEVRRTLYYITSGLYGSTRQTSLHESHPSLAALLLVQLPFLHQES